MIYTREQLIGMGMSETQIEAILKQQAEEIAQNQTQPVVEKKEYTESDITSITDIVKYTGGTIVRLPDFAEGAPFIAKLKRPSLLVLAKSGKIPNSLINQATDLFKSGAGSLGTKGNSIEDLYEIMEIICDAALVQPSYQEIKAQGITLNDEQMMAIFGYTQQGVKALESFR